MFSAGLAAAITAEALAGQDKTNRLAVMSAAEVRKALVYLRGKARIRDLK
jgi:hypothetical protein